MTGSNWSNTLMLSVESKGWIGAPFFIFVYIIGNMIFLNVFAAILIDSYCKTLMDLVQDEESSTPTQEVQEGQAPFSPTGTFCSSPSNLMPRIPSLLIAEAAIDQLPSFRELPQRAQEAEKNEEFALHGRSFCYFGVEHPLRRKLSVLIRTDEYKYCIIFSIFVSSAFLTLDSNRPETSPVVRSILEISGIVIAILFTLEMLMKMIVNQALFGRGAYIRNLWNVLDMTVAAISITGVFYPKMMFLRALRSLAALRMIKRIPGIKDVVLSLIESIRKSLTIITVAAFTCLLFAIMGVQLMAGSFYACTDEAVTYRDDCTGSYMTSEGVVQPREWQQQFASHYDNIWTAYLTTFELTTGENWQNIMLAGMDSVGEGVAMKRNASPWMSVYFVIVVFVMMCFFLNMITGIVVDAAQKLLVENLFPGLTEVEREWMLTLEALEKFQCKPLPQPPAGRLQRELYFLVKSPKFEGAVVCCITINCLLMTLSYYGEPVQLTRALLYMQNTFTQLFMIELVLKLSALGSKTYFKSRWNCFDFVLVIFGYMEIWVKQVESMQFLTSLRVLRLIRLIRHVPGTGPIFQTMFVSIIALRHVICVMALTIFVYAIFGVALFGNVKYQTIISPYCNFESFPNALHVLFRVMTGDGWNGIMHELNVKEPTCSQDEGNCGSWLAVPYIIVFIALMRFIMLNIIIAFVLMKYRLCQKEKNRLVGHRCLNDFREVWQKFDVLGKGYVPLECIYDIMTKLPPPLGLNNQRWTARMFLPIVTSLNLPVFRVDFGKPSRPRLSSNALLSLVQIFDTTSKSTGACSQDKDGADTRVRTLSVSSKDSIKDCISFQNTIQVLAARVYIREVVNRLPKHMRKKHSHFIFDTIQVLRQRSFLQMMRDTAQGQSASLSNVNQTADTIKENLDVKVELLDMPAQYHLAIRMLVRIVRYNRTRREISNRRRSSTNHSLSSYSQTHMTFPSASVPSKNRRIPLSTTNHFKSDTELYSYDVSEGKGHPSTDSGNDTPEKVAVEHIHIDLSCLEQQIDDAM